MRDSTLTRLAAPADWLFPGLSPARPADPGSLHSGLLRHGIAAKPARNTALSILATDLPTSILADVADLNISTAAQWTRRARRDAIDYVAARMSARDECATTKPPRSSPSP